MGGMRPARPTRPARTSRRLAGIAVVCAMAFHTAAAGEPSSTIGRLATLVRHASRPETVGTLRGALGDDRPEVRAVAARVIHASGALVPAGVLRDALAEETDPLAAREEANALIHAEGAQAVDTVLEVARRFDGGTRGDLALAAARGVGDAGLGDFADTILAMPLPATRRAACLLAASRLEPDRLDTAAARALAAGDADLWIALLEDADTLNLQPGVPILSSALRTGSEAIATRTAWRLAEEFAFKSVADPAPFLSALEERGEHNAGVGSADDRLGLELLARALGRAPRESAAWIASLGTGETSRLDPPLTSRRLLSLLTRDEHRALRKRVRRSFPHERLPELLSTKEKETRRNAEPSVRPPPARLATGFPRGLIRATLDARGCALPGRPLAGAAKVRYEPRGRPTAVVHWIVPEDPSCREAMTDLFALSVAPDGHVPDPAIYETLLLILARDTISALEEKGGSPEAVPSQSDLWQRIEPPKRTRFVKPEYPEEERLSRHTARIILELVVDEEGHISGARLLKGVREAFILSAFRAVSQWRYAPATLDGKEVPVHLTVIIDYNLR